MIKSLKNRKYFNLSNKNINNNDTDDDNNNNNKGKKVKCCVDPRVTYF